MNPRIGPVRVPAIEIPLRLVEGFEALPPQRGLLGMADAGFDLPLAVGIADATRERDDAIVGEHVAVERIQRRIVDVGGEDAFLQVVEDDEADRPAEPTKGLLVQFGPDLRTRPPHEEADRFTRVAERQHEEARPPVLAGLGMAHHRPLAVVDLGFLLMESSP